MTLGQFKQDLALILDQNGASIYNYTDWDDQADRFLLRQINNFFWEARLRYLVKEPFAVQSGDIEINFTDAAVIHPHKIWINGDLLREIEIYALREVTTDAVDAAMPYYWARSERPYIVKLDCPIAAAYSAGTNYVSGWAVHTLLRNDEDDLLFDDRQLDPALAYCAYKFMVGATADQVSDTALQRFNATAMEFIEKSSAEATQRVLRLMDG